MILLGGALCAVPKKDLMIAPSRIGHQEIFDCLERAGGSECWGKQQFAVPIPVKQKHDPTPQQTACFLG